MRWNRTPIYKGNTSAPVDQNSIKNTFGLFRASLEDALFYGGEVTRHALDAFNIKGDRDYVVVDTKIHMLMPGMCPAIPGWHTDGVLRWKDVDDVNTINNDFGLPSVREQESYERQTERHNHYHIMAYGQSTTQFIAEDNIELPTPDGPNHDLYRIMTRHVNDYVKRGRLSVMQIDPATVYEFDWWRIHSAPIAKKREWRYLIRVTESDWYAPTTSKEDMIRRQSQVYMPMEYGW